MARSFIASNTDFIDLPAIGYANLTTWAFWLRRTASTVGQMIASRGTEYFYTDTSLRLVFGRTWSGGDGAIERISASGPAVGAWTHVAFTYDSGNAASNGTFSIGGVAVSTAPYFGTVSGAPLTTAGGWRLGRETNGTFPLDAEMAEWAVWHRHLGAGEIAALAKGYSPAFFGRGLVSDVPLIREVYDRRVAGTATVTGTAYAAHPRVHVGAGSSQRTCMARKPKPPSSGNTRVTSAGDQRVTSAGDVRVTT